jgi:glycine cleavage system transcriptional repressor
MARTFVVSVSCPDRTGLVAAVTGRLFDLGGNLGDTSFAVLGASAEFTSLVDAPDHLSAEEVAAELVSLPDLDGAEVKVSDFDLATDHGPMGRESHVITVSGGDQPGLVARITEVFVQFGANIVRLDAARERGPEPTGHYTTRFAVAIPEANVDKCLATVANTAGAMDLRCTWISAQK